MNDADSMDPLPPRTPHVLGEQRARRWPFAILMGLAAPGLGYLYVGRWITGLVVAIGMHVVTLGVFAYYIATGRDLDAMLTTAMIITGVMWVAQALPATWWAWQRSSTYRLTKANHSRAYIGFVGFTVLLRMIDRAVAGTFLFAVLAANDPGMTPTIEQGAQVAVVRWGFDPTRLVPGDVVAWDAAAPGEAPVPAFGRVVATPRQRVVMSGDFAIVDGVPTQHRPCSAAEQAPFRDSDGGGRCRHEVIGGEGRVVAASHDDGPPTAEVVVPDGAVFLLGDDRDRAKDGRTTGAVPHGKLFGRATAIVGGTDRRGPIP